MNYGEIKEFDVANGEGVRVTLFVSGCTNHCEGCFQPQTWDFTYGRRFDGAAEKKILDFLDFPYADGVTFLGGEPMEPDNQRELVKLAHKIRETHPDKTIWCFTGFVYDRDLVPGGKRYIEVTCAEILLLLTIFWISLTCSWTVRLFSHREISRSPSAVLRTSVSLT